MESTNSTSEESSDHNHSTENNSISQNLVNEEQRQANFENNNSDTPRNPLNGEDPDESGLITDILEIIRNRQRKKLFKTKELKKRGKQKEQKSFLGKKHSREDFDNILTKIQVNFITFLINIANDVALTEFDSLYLKNLVKDTFKVKSPTEFVFKHIGYTTKKQINYEYIMKIIQNPIKDLIISDISTKYRSLKSYPKYNKILYEKLAEKSEWFSEFFDMKFIDAFVEYYYNMKKALDKIEFKGKTIDISADTKSFYYLLKENEHLSDSMIDVINNVYLNVYNKINPFKIIKNST